MNSNKAIQNAIKTLTADGIVMGALPEFKADLRRGKVGAFWGYFEAPESLFAEVLGDHTFYGLSDDEILRFVATVLVKYWGADAFTDEKTARTIDQRDRLRG